MTQTTVSLAEYVTLEQARNRVMRAERFLQEGLAKLAAPKNSEAVRFVHDSLGEYLAQLSELARPFETQRVPGKPEIQITQWERNPLSLLYEPIREGIDALLSTNEIVHTYPLLAVRPKNFDFGAPGKMAIDQCSQTYVEALRRANIIPENCE